VRAWAQYSRAHQPRRVLLVSLLRATRTQASKKTLTPEEAKARAAELQARAKLKREAAERVNDKDRERQRIAMGKELAAAQRQEDDVRFKRLADERRRDKEEVESARAKMRAKLAEDRCECNVLSTVL
jgi:hypothetical protein